MLDDLAEPPYGHLLLVLFPIVFVFDTRLGTIMLVAAIVLQYRKSKARSVAWARTTVANENQKPWRDPWMRNRLIPTAYFVLGTRDPAPVHTVQSRRLTIDPGPAARLRR